jgi:tetratricopeptide (TPR) repeat protein
MGEILEEMKQALELDPHNFSILQQISLTYQALRRYEEALSTLDSVLAIAPKDAASRCDGHGLPRNGAQT